MQGDDVVILDVIRITEDPSTERTAPLRSTHVRNSHVSSFLIQQGEERLMEIQQHDGVVVEVADPGRASPSASGEEEVSREGEGGARA